TIALGLDHAVPQLHLTAGADRRAVHREQDGHSQHDEHQRRDPGAAMRIELVSPHARFVATDTTLSKREAFVRIRRAGWPGTRRRKRRSYPALRCRPASPDLRGGCAGPAVRAILRPAQPLFGAKTWARWLMRACTGPTSACCRSA